MMRKVKTLLKVPNIRLDRVDNSNRTVFTLATFWGFQTIALALIETSQAFPISDKDQLSGLVFAAKQGHKELCLRTLEHLNFEKLHHHIDYSGKGILHHAAINDWSDLLELCFVQSDGRLRVDQLDHTGKTALHLPRSWAT